MRAETLISSGSPKVSGAVLPINTLVFVCIVSALAACTATTYAYSEVRVTSSDPTNFYFFSRAVWDAKRLGSPNSDRSATAVANFGPLSIGSRVSAEKGMAYVFVPVCRGQIAWDKPSYPVISDQDEINVQC
jgi:hypothetical protein